MELLCSQIPKQTKYSTRAKCENALKLFLHWLSLKLYFTNSYIHCQLKFKFKKISRHQSHVWSSFITVSVSTRNSSDA